MSLKSYQLLNYYDSTVYIKDFLLLEGPFWLNDTLIGFYMDYLQNEHCKELSVCFIRPELTQCLKLLQDLHIFLDPLSFKTKDYVLMVLNDCINGSSPGGTHWSLLVYCRDTHKFHHLDSLDGTNSYAAKALSLKIATYLGNRNTYYFEDSVSLQQSNSYDCGLFVLCNIDNIIENVVRKRKNIASLEKISLMHVLSKRGELKKLIIDLRKRGINKTDVAREKMNSERNCDESGEPATLPTSLTEVKDKQEEQGDSVEENLEKTTTSSMEKTQETSVEPMDVNDSLNKETQISSEPTVTKEAEDLNEEGQEQLTTKEFQDSTTNTGQKKNTEEIRKKTKPVITLRMKQMNNLKTEVDELGEELKKNLHGKTSLQSRKEKVNVKTVHRTTLADKGKRTTEKNEPERKNQTKIRMQNAKDRFEADTVLRNMITDLKEPIVRKKNVMRIRKEMKSRSDPSVRRKRVQLEDGQSEAQPKIRRSLRLQGKTDKWPTCA